MPIVKYDITPRKELSITNKQGVFLHYFTLFLIIISFEPFGENLLHLPSVIANSDYAAKMYDSRVEYLSFIGRKLNRADLPSITILFFAKKNNIKKNRIWTYNGNFKFLDS